MNKKNIEKEENHSNLILIGLIIAILSIFAILPLSQPNELVENISINSTNITDNETTNENVQVNITVFSKIEIEKENLIDFIEQV